MRRDAVAVRSERRRLVTAAIGRLGLDELQLRIRHVRHLRLVVEDVPARGADRRDPDVAPKVEGLLRRGERTEARGVDVETAEHAIRSRCEHPAHARIDRAAEDRAVHQPERERRLTQPGDVIARVAVEVAVVIDRAEVRQQRVVGVAGERQVDVGDHVSRLVCRLVRVVVEIERQHTVCELQPLGAITLIDDIGTAEVVSVNRSVRALQVRDREPEQALDLLVRVVLRVVVEAELRRIDRFLHDDLAVQVGRHLPAPRLQDIADAEQVPALFGFGLCVHVDEVLAESPVDIAPLLRAVIAGGIVAHASPGGDEGGSGGRGIPPLLCIHADESTVEHRRRHEPVEHRREIQIRRHRLGGVWIGVDVEEALAARREDESADDGGAANGVHSNACHG